MRILIVGAGATGGYFGGRLAAVGRDVTFLVRPAHLDRLGTQGLQIVSPFGNATVFPALITADQIAKPFDIILLTVKAYSLTAALDDIASAIGPDTMILPVLNGMKHVDAIMDRFGANALVGCVCRIAAELDDKGRIVQLARFQELAYGEMDGHPSGRMERLDEFMNGAGFTARLSPEIAREMWEKWLLLASLGGITCLMRGNIGQIEAAPGGRDFIMGLLDEAITIIKTVGKPPSAKSVDEARTLLMAKGSPFTSSMYRDLQKGQKIEADQILGDLLARGQKAGVAAPLLSAAFTNLCVYQNQLA